MGENNYYVYIYLDPSKPGFYKYNDLNLEFEPIYVGKGTKNRMQKHLSPYNLKRTDNYFYKKLNKIVNKQHLKPIYFKLEDNLSETESLISEINFIKLIGRRDLKLGTLCNLSDGGETNLNKIISLKARTHSGTFKTGNKPKHIKKGWRLQTQEEKDNRAKKLKGHIVTEETRQKIRKAHGGVPILQYDLKGNFIKEWSGLRICINAGYKAVNAMFYQKRRMANGYLWIKKENNIILSNIEPYIAPKRTQTKYKNL